MHKHSVKTGFVTTYPYSKVVGSLSVCMYVCNFPHNSGTVGPIWPNFFLLAPSWSRGGFRPKKFRIRDPVFPEIRKNPDFENFENIGTFRYSYKIDHNSIFFASMIA